MSDLAEGWDAIAAAVGVTPRHAQRLAAREGLPVRGKGKGRRWATIAELAEWSATRDRAPASDVQLCRAMSLAVSLESDQNGSMAITIRLPDRAAATLEAARAAATRRAGYPVSKAAFAAACLERGAAAIAAEARAEVALADEEPLTGGGGQAA